MNKKEIVNLIEDKEGKKIIDRLNFAYGITGVPEEIKHLEGQEIKLLDLSNKLVELGYEDIFNLNLHQILKDGNIVVDDIQIFFSNVKNKDDLLNCTIQIDNDEIPF